MLQPSRLLRRCTDCRDELPGGSQERATTWVRWSERLFMWSMAPKCKPGAAAAAELVDHHASWLGQLGRRCYVGWLLEGNRQGCAKVQK